jgi:hypothetical protein
MTDQNTADQAGNLAAKTSTKTVHAVFHCFDEQGRRRDSYRVSLEVPVDEGWQEWIVRFEDKAVCECETKEFFEVIIFFRFDGLDKKLSWLEYLHNIFSPKIGKLEVQSFWSI